MCLLCKEDNSEKFLINMEVKTVKFGLLRDA